MASPTPIASAPPSHHRLLGSTVLAALVAGVLLVTIVLPAEWGIDPTGVGRVLGLKEMGEIKMRLVKEEAAHLAEQASADSANAAASSPAPVQAAATAPAAPSAKSDSTQVTLLPSQGKEIKLVMTKDQRVSFSWKVNRGVVNYDTHADSPTIKYHGYAKGNAVMADSGQLVAAFDGHHGWFWRNRGADTVTVTLKVSGDYQELKHMP